jgi:hypothetical protein
MHLPPTSHHEECYLRLYPCTLHHPSVKLGFQATQYSCCLTSRHRQKLSGNDLSCGEETITGSEVQYSVPLGQEPDCLHQRAILKFLLAPAISIFGFAREYLELVDGWKRYLISIETHVSLLSLNVRDARL